MLTAVVFERSPGGNAVTGITRSSAEVSPRSSPPMGWPLLVCRMPFRRRVVCAAVEVGPRARWRALLASGLDGVPWHRCATIQAVSNRSRAGVVDYVMRGPLVGVQRGAWTAAAVVLVVGVVAGIWMPGDRWGALAAWFGTVGTLIAVAFAAGTARHEAEAAAIRAREEQAEGEIQQARLVTVEVTACDPDDPSVAGQYDVDVRITNHSDAVVLDPRLEGFTHPARGEVSWGIAELPGFGDYTGPPTVLAPGAYDMFPVNITYRPELPQGTLAWKSQAVIGFTDAAGRRWRRIGSSLPVRIPVTSPAAVSKVATAAAFKVSGPDGYRIDQ
jgi:hypothetical protein